MGQQSFSLEEYGYSLKQILPDDLKGIKWEHSIERDVALRAKEVITIWRLAGERLGHFEWPADWWQAFKERWFLPWMKRRWPVYNRTVDIKCLYPRISLPREEHFLKVDQDHTQVQR